MLFCHVWHTVDSRLFGSYFSGISPASHSGKKVTRSQKRRSIIHCLRLCSLFAPSDNYISRLRIALKFHFSASLRNPQAELAILFLVLARSTRPNAGEGRMRKVNHVAFRREFPLRLPLGHAWPFLSVRAV